jgi:putative intracellular protease/amidase
MKVAILLFDGITALDAVGPYESLARIAQSEIAFVAKQAGPIRTGDGFLALF